MKILLNNLSDVIFGQCPYENIALFADDGGGDSGGGGTPADGGGQGGQPPAEGGQPPADQKPAALDETAVSGLIEKALKPYQDRIADLQSTNIILQGMMRERQAPAQQAPTEPSEPQMPDKDKFIEEMNADPAATILKLINTHVLPKVNKTVDNATAETRQQQEQRQTLERAITADQSTAMEIASAWTEGSPERELFDQYGEEELTRLCPPVIINGKKMPDPKIFRPGMLETAALRAERRLRAEGKSPQPAQSQPQQSTGTKIVQFPRSTKPSPGAPTGGPVVPKTIDDLVASGKLTAADAAIAKSNCKKWSMTEERFVINWNETEKENPHYGTGL